MSRFSWKERWKTVATDAYTMLEDVLSLAHGVNRLYDMLAHSEISAKSDLDVPEVDVDDLSEGGTHGIWWAGTLTAATDNLIDSSIDFRYRMIHYAIVPGDLTAPYAGKFAGIDDPISSNLFQRAFVDRWT